MKKLFSLLFAAALFVSVAASQAGAVAWVSPSGNAPGPTGGLNSFLYGTNIHGGANILGSTIAAAIGTPTAPTMVVNGTTGSTSLVYACTAFDYNGAQTIPSATATITTANATLSATNSVSVTCPGKTGALGFLIHKVDTTHVIGSCYTKSNTACTFIDTGTYTNGNGGASQTTSFTYTANTIDATGSVSMWPPLTTGGGLFANLPACSVANAGQGFVITNSSAVSAEGQTCVGASTHTAMAVCLDGAVWKCF